MPAVLSPEQEAALKATPGAWEFWERSAPSYRRAATHWVTRAKKEETAGEAARHPGRLLRRERARPATALVRIPERQLRDRDSNPNFRNQNPASYH